jgi:hypothetical protein
VTVIDHPVRTVPAEKKAPDSRVFALWRWYPIAPVSAAASTDPAPNIPARQHPVEVIEVFASRGSSIGFRRRDGQLIAVAGATTRSLEEGHYTWRTVPGTSLRETRSDLASEKSFFDIVGTIASIPFMFLANTDDDDDPFDCDGVGSSTSKHGSAYHPSPHTAPPHPPLREPTSRPWKK